MPTDHSGGNFDDAFSMGMGAGEVSLARGLLKKFFPEETKGEK